VINITYLLSCAVSKLWPIIGQIVAINRGCFTLTTPLGVIPCEYPNKLYLPKNYRDCRTLCWEPHDRIFIPLDKTSERDGMTDRQTDRQKMV